MTNESIYMIFRVFNLGSKNAGLRIYADPDQLRRDGKLKFAANRWTITPAQVVVE